MDTDNNTTNQNMPQRPFLKKVKRPINRTPQMPMPATAAPAQTGKPAFNQATASDPFRKPQASSGINNPFISKSGNEDAFNLDAYLDDDNLPAKTPAASNPAAPRKFLGEDDLPAPQSEPSPQTGDDYEDAILPVSDVPPYLTKKILLLLGAVLFFLGIITAKVFFAEEKIVRNGLQGVVVNPEVPKGRARCGVAERTQGCVLYVMNPQRQEMAARDFYDLASQLTGRQRFVIETGNMRYSNTKIRPGDIAQFNIPPL